MLDNSLLVNIDQPIEQALGLPSDVYTRDDVFEIEKRQVLFRNWAALTVTARVPGNGDVLPVDFAGVQLCAVRDHNGGVRVLENLCPECGTILLEYKVSDLANIECPRCGCRYSLDGLTSGSSEKKPQRSDEVVGTALKNVRSYIWRDIVFINVDGEAPDFTVYAADLIERWGEYESPMFHGGCESSFTLEVKGNWKLAVENFAEAYHLPWIHPGLNSFSRLEDHYNIQVAGCYSGQGSVCYRPMLSDSGSRFDNFQGLGPKWSQGAEYVALYPNVLLGVHRDHAYSIILQPTALGHTVEHVDVYYASKAMQGDDWAELRSINSNLLRTIFEEDVFVVEGMQRGRSSSRFDGGKFSPVMDGPTHCFHAWVADQLRT